MRSRPLRGALTPLPCVGVVLLLLLSVAAEAVAQTPFIPYFGKNRIKYDTFDWHIYDTDHFEIYYYPEIKPHLERITGYLESAYQHISSELKHDLAAKVPVVFFKTHSEFEQQNIIPGASPEGVLAFAESQRDRMVLPIDLPPDQLYRLIVHELTHIFEYDIIPQSLVRRSVPLWVYEGLSDYMAGYWDPLDLMTVRDAAIADIIPRMSEFESVAMLSGRLPYNLGHAAFEFIESRWGKEGIRQFLFSLRKAVIGGGESAYEEALRLKAEEFDQEFEKYLKDRFRPFRDKERPADYGRNLAPRPDRTKFPIVISIEPSPSGDLLAAAALNRRDRELDIILISTKDGQVVRNLTPGFDKNMGWTYISQPIGRGNSVPWMSWSPQGDRLAYFVRTEKERTLILQNVVTRRVDRRIPMKTVDAPESPNIAPDGRRVAFAGLRGAVGDIFVVDVETQEVTNVTNDEFNSFAPVFAPDGQSLVYLARVSGNDKLFRVDLQTGEKRQLTFGTHDEAAAQFLDEHKLVFPSTALDPNTRIDPEEARNGNIYNIWTLDLKTGELRQYTDALTGNLSAIVLPGEERRVAFVTYFKGEYGIHSIQPTEPMVEAASEDFGAPGPIIDFQAPLTHTLVADNTRRKGRFEKLFLEGRPPVNVGVTSGGDLFGGSAVTFTDVLGDRQFNMFAASIAQYRTLSFSYLNLSRRFHYATQAFSQTQFFYALDPGLFYDPGFAPFISRDMAVATRTVRGGSAFGIYPIDRYRRLELFGGAVQYQERYNDPALANFAEEFQRERFGTQIFRSGTFVPFGIAFVQETTVFREFGPLAGNTMRVGYEIAPRIGNSLSRQTADIDARYYQRLGTSGVLAFRGRGFRSWGHSPDFLFFGGNSEMRGYEYLEFLGHNAFFANAELRFPLIEAMLTPLGILGGIRGVFFLNVGGASFNNVPMRRPGGELDDFRVYATGGATYRPVIDYRIDPATGFPQEVLGAPARVSGFRLVDARASYGIGLETFALGFPIHFDWSWRTLFNREWEDVLFAFQGAANGKSGSEWFRRPRFAVWIGYDF
jgi:hypothetical protein